MRRMKFIIFAILCAIVIAVLGEAQMLSMMKYQEKQSESVSVAFEEGDETGGTQIEVLAKKHGVALYCISDDGNTGINMSSIVYYTGGSEKAVREATNLIPGTMKSLLLGDIDVTYKQMSEMKKETFDVFFLDDTGADAFCSELKNNCETKRRAAKDTSVNEYDAVCIAIIVIALLFMFILCCADVAFSKKEVFVKLTLGERLSSYILKRYGVDVGVFALEFGILAVIASCFISLVCAVKLLIIFVAVYAVIAFIPYISLVFMNYRRMAHGSGISSNMLMLNYALFALTTIMLFVVFSLGISMYDSTKRYIIASDFFDENDSHCSIVAEYNLDENPDPIEQKKQMNKNWELKSDIYRNHYNDYEPIALVNLTPENDGRYIIYTNAGAGDYLKSVIDEFDPSNLKNDICILLPASCSEAERKKLISETKNAVSNADDRDAEFDCDIILYNGNVNVLYLSFYGGLDPFSFTESPCIFFTKEPVEAFADRRLSFPKDTIYKIDNAAATELVKEFGLEKHYFEKMNVHDYYEHFWVLIKASLIAIVALVCLLIVIEGILISTIVKLEYTVDAIELSIKKVLGYTILQKNTYIFEITAISTLISFGVSFYICGVKLGAPISAILIMAALVFIFEVAIIVNRIVKVENTSIVKILKGGSL